MIRTKHGIDFDFAKKVATQRLIQFNDFFCPQSIP